MDAMASPVGLVSVLAVAVLCSVAVALASAAGLPLNANVGHVVRACIVSTLYDGPHTYRSLQEALDWCPLGKDLAVIGQFAITSPVVINASRSGTASKPFRIYSLTGRAEDFVLNCAFAGAPVPVHVGPRYLPTRCVELTAASYVEISHVTIVVTAANPTVSALAVLRGRNVVLQHLLISTDTVSGSASGSSSIWASEGRDDEVESALAAARVHPDGRFLAGGSQGWEVVLPIVAFYGVDDPNALWQTPGSTIWGLFSDDTELAAGNTIRNVNITFGYCRYSTAIYANLQRQLQIDNVAVGLAQYNPMYLPVHALHIEMSREVQVSSTIIFNSTLRLGAPIFNTQFSNLEMSFGIFQSSFAAIESRQQQLTTLPSTSLHGLGGNTFTQLRVLAPGSKISGVLLDDVHCSLFEDITLVSSMPPSVSRITLRNSTGNLLLRCAGYFEAAGNATTQVIAPEDAIWVSEQRENVVAGDGKVAAWFPPLYDNCSSVTSGAAAYVPVTQPPTPAPSHRAVLYAALGVILGLMAVVILAIVVLLHWARRLPAGQGELGSSRGVLSASIQPSGRSHSQSPANGKAPRSPKSSRRADSNRLPERKSKAKCLLRTVAEEGSIQVVPRDGEGGKGGAEEGIYVPQSWSSGPSSEHFQTLALRKARQKRESSRSHTAAGSQRINSADLPSPEAQLIAQPLALYGATAAAAFGDSVNTIVSTTTPVGSTGEPSRSPAPDASTVKSRKAPSQAPSQPLPAPSQAARPAGTGGVVLQRVSYRSIHSSDYSTSASEEGEGASLSNDAE